MRRRVLTVVGSYLAALGLVVAIPVVVLGTRVGPLVVVLGPGLGLHALDVVLIVGGVPLAVALLRSVERLREDLEDETGGGWFWERWR